MSLSLTKSSYQIDSTIGMVHAQAICKTTLELPEEKPDIGRLLSAKLDAKLDASGIEVAENRVSVVGNLVLEVPYIAVYKADSYGSDKEPIHFICSQEASFKTDAEVIGAAEGMDAIVDAEVDSFEVDTSGSRAVSITAIVKVNIKVVSPQKLNLVSDIADVDTDKFKVSKRNLFVEKRVAESTSPITIREAFQVPEGKADIGELLDYTASVFVPAGGARISTNRAIVAGTMDLRIAYLGDLDEKPLQFLVGPEIDFQTAIDLPGAAEGMSTRGKAVLDSLTLSKIGSRTIQVEAVLSVSADASSIVELGVVESISAVTDDAVDIQKTRVQLESLVGQMASGTAVTETFSVGSGKPDIDELLMANAKARITEIKVIPDKVTLIGEVDVYTTYSGQVTEPGEIASIEAVQQLGLPFEVQMELVGVEPGMLTLAKADIVSIDAVKAGPRTIDIDVKLGTSVKVIEDVEFDAIIDAAVVPSLPKSATPNRRITVYVVQRGDTMWKVARRYEKTMGKIAEINKLNTEELYPGQKLFIPS